MQNTMNKTPKQNKMGHSPLILEQASGQTTIYDSKLNVIFRVDGRHYDALYQIIDKANHADDLQSRNDALMAACRSAFDGLRREGPQGFDSAAERLSDAIAANEKEGQ